MIMREIKFRWVGRNRKFNEITINKDLTVQKILDGNVLSFFNNSNRGNTGNCEFLSEDLFIGLADEYGIDIYEGDVLISPLGEIFKIKWRNSMFILENREGITRGIHYNLNMWKVIGNIHENPELLK